jgi:hypothetical protein
MRIMNFSTRKLLVGAMALAMAAMVSQAFADSVPQAITVIRVKGMARYASSDNNWHPVRKGDVLKPGTVIQTGPKALVDIQLGEREAATAPVSYNPNSTMYAPEDMRANVVRIFENSALSVDKLAVDRTGAGDEVSDTQLDLRAGQIMGNVKKLSSASKYEVKIPNGVAGIRGTVYMINSAGVINVLTGSVVIAIVGADGTVTTRVVTAHESYDPATNTITRLTEDQIKALEKIIQEMGPSPNNPGPIPGQPIIYVSPNN